VKQCYNTLSNLSFIKRLTFQSSYAFCIAQFFARVCNSSPITRHTFYHHLLTHIYLTLLSTIQYLNRNLKLLNPGSKCIKTTNNIQKGQRNPRQSAVQPGMKGILAFCTLNKERMAQTELLSVFNEVCRNGYDSTFCVRVGMSLNSPLMFALYTCCVVRRRALWRTQTEHQDQRS
jgi:hypothetical protein